MLPSFNNMCEAIGQFGPGYVGPSMYQLREPLLKKAVSRTSVGLEPHKKLWETNGCTLMTDSWTDRKQRCVMNMCIHSSAGIIFYNSIEESAESHTGDFIFKWVDQCIQEIGADYVVQVVTDNHSANMAAKEKLKSERPRIFWTSCAAHTTNLMLQDIGKLTKFQNTIDRARALTVFIYSHTRTLALMRKCTRRKDIVRPGTTRFATSFLTLGSLLEKKNELMAMFNSDEFMNLKFVGGAKKKAATANATVISRSFWRGVRSCLKIFTPLFKFLRMVDSDTCPSMGFIIGELEIVKREIMAAWKIEKEYKPIISIIDKHAQNRLDSPLHLAAWFLNPLFYYAEDEMAKKSAEAKQAVLDCAELFFRNGDTIDEAIVDTIYSTEMLKYRDCDAFIHGKPRAQRVVKRIAEDRNPAHWWDIFGGDMPYMQMMALRILRLTGSSSGCERNWSCFEGIHTKKRNRLDSKRLSDLVYVQFNLRIRTKMDTTRKDGKKRDILLAKDGRHASSWVVDGYNSEEEEDYYPGTDIPLGVISEAAGTDEFLQPRRTTRSGSANRASSSRAREEVDLEDDEEGPIEDSDSDEEDIQLDDDDSDEDALRDEILLLGTANDDEDDE